MQMGEKNRENSLSEIFNDYEKTPVPPKARQTWFEQGMVWLGSGFGLSGLATGGLLANGLSFKEMLLVSVLGSLIITLLGMLNAIVSTHLHLSTSFTARRPFGRQGAKIIGIILCFSNFGWYAFQADLFGNTVSSIIREVRGTADWPCPSPPLWVLKLLKNSARSDFRFYSSCVSWQCGKQPVSFR